jgi:hypothetical protein
MSNEAPRANAGSTDERLIKTLAAIAAPSVAAIFLFFVDSASVTAAAYLSVIVAMGAFIFIVKPLPRFLLTRLASMLVVAVAITFVMATNAQIKVEEDRLAQVHAEETRLAQLRA